MFATIVLILLTVAILGVLTFIQIKDDYEKLFVRVDNMKKLLFTTNKIAQRELKEVEKSVDFADSVTFSEYENILMVAEVIRKETNSFGKLGIPIYKNKAMELNSELVSMINELRLNVNLLKEVCIYKKALMKQ